MGRKQCCCGKENAEKQMKTENGSETADKCGGEREKTAESTQDNNLEKHGESVLETVPAENITADVPCTHDCECCAKTKQRQPEEYKRLINRLNRILGQINGIKGMVEKNAYCTDIIIQVAAVNAALNSFNKELLSSHIRSCVADNIRSGNDEVIDELVNTLQKLMK